MRREATGDVRQTTGPGRAARVLTTNDFVGSFFPQPTSDGELPGAAALQATIDDLRTEGGDALWIDTGDLASRSGAGPTATLAVSPYTAAAVGAALRRAPEWHRTEHTWRDGLLAAVTR